MPPSLPVSIYLRQPVDMAAINAVSELRLAKAFQQKCWGRVFIIRLSGSQKDPLTINWVMQEATVLRWVAIDAAVDLFRRQKNLLPPRELPDLYVSHLTANIRRVLVDEPNDKKIEWTPTRRGRVVAVRAAVAPGQDARRTQTNNAIGFGRMEPDTSWRKITPDLPLKWGGRFIAVFPDGEQSDYDLKGYEIGPGDKLPATGGEPSGREYVLDHWEQETRPVESMLVGILRYADSP